MLDADLARMKDAVCAAIDQALPAAAAISGLRIDVKIDRQGVVTKVIAWPEVEFLVVKRPDLQRYV